MFEAEEFLRGSFYWGWIETYNETIVPDNTYKNSYLYIKVEHNEVNNIFRVELKEGIEKMW